MPQKWGFSPICDPPRFFFKNRALSLLYPYGALTSCKKLEKTNERSLRYLKTDGRTNGRTDMGDYIGPPWVNPGSKICFKKRHIIFVEHPTRLGPNFRSKASVTFLNCGGRREKMKCLKTAKTQKNSTF